jgi:phosphoribosyl-dephospho-CoA transferase
MKVSLLAATIVLMSLYALADESGITQAYQQALSAKIGQEMTISLNCQASQIVDKQRIADLEKRVKELEEMSGYSDRKIQEIK